jgi:hypothetical protein
MSGRDTTTGIALVFALTCAAGAHAQIPDTLVGSRVRAEVITAVGDRTWTRGTLTGVNDSTFTILLRDGAVSTLRVTQLRSLDISVGTRTLGRRGMVLGALAGGVAVGLAAAISEARCDGWCFGVPAGFAIGFVVGAVPGTAIGGLIGRSTRTDRWVQYSPPRAGR